MQIIENLQRQDVHPLEEADGYKALLDSTPSCTNRSWLQRAVVGAAVAAALLAAIIWTTIDNHALPRIPVETPNGTTVTAGAAGLRLLDGA